MTSKTLRRLLLTAVLGVGALTSVAWGETGAPRFVDVREGWRDHYRDEARERHAREERRERERREHEWRERHWRHYDWR